ncbi:MAG: FKBP-type peptidyl-prolyl cis-trans isomerase [Planctomycetota bacterium]|jgi:FKBP-type peptidyl-prolyl cis-trans isomerase
MRAKTIVLTLALLLLSACEPPSVKVSETPITIANDRGGFGDPVGPGDVVRIDYVVELPNGRELLRQKDFRFQIGTDSVIRGIDEAVAGMRIGGRREFVCPPHKHWGRAGYGKVVPPATDLHITLSLVKVENRDRRRVASGG